MTPWCGTLFRSESLFVVSHDFEFIVRTCTEVVQLDDQGAVQNHRLTPEILKALSEQYFH